MCEERKRESRLRNPTSGKENTVIDASRLDPAHLHSLDTHDLNRFLQYLAVLIIRDLLLRFVIRSNGVGSASIRDFGLRIPILGCVIIIA